MVGQEEQTGEHNRGREREHSHVSQDNSRDSPDVANAVDTRELARILKIASATLSKAYRRADERRGTDLDEREAERDAALLDVDQATPGGHRRWSRRAAARILRAFGRSVPAAWA
jgi:hypothetical protein